MTVGNFIPNKKYGSFKATIFFKTVVVLFTVFPAFPAKNRHKHCREGGKTFLWSAILL
jgi:hypothetical protein